MAQLNKNEAARLRKVQQSLEKVLDALHAANGLLYPQGLKPYKEQIANLIKDAERLEKKLTSEIPKTKPRNQPDAGQIDIEDFDDDGDDGERQAAE